MRKVLKDYARQILADHGCNEYTYGDTPAETILSDLKEGYPDGMDYPYIDVANAIMAVSKRKPIKRDTWHAIWDNVHCCDGFDTPSLAQGKQDALDLLIEWMVQERAEWASDTPTGEEADHWNYMIYNFSAGVSKYNPDTDEYEEYWYPSDKQKARIGWKVIKTYKIKPEYIDRWGSEANEDTIVSEPEVEQFARDWDCTVSDLLEQLTPYDW